VVTGRSLGIAATAALLACRASPPGRAPGGIELVDDRGAITRLERPATRVVSLIPAATELVFAIGAGDALVGRTRWCDYPAEARQVPSVGDGIGPNVEAVVAARPDLVLMYSSPSNVAATSTLRGLGVPVLELVIDRYADFRRGLRLVATAVGREAAGDSVARATETAVAEASVVEATRPTVLIVAWTDPPMTIGGASFLDEILDRAGARNLFADVDRPSFPVSLEAVAARNPDWVLVVDDLNPEFVDSPSWQAIAAVRERRFVRVSGSMFNRPSPRMGQAITTLRAALRRGDR